jgi:hypothetical protein
MTITPDAIATLIQQAPRWALHEITASNPRVRDAAAHELGEYVASRLHDPVAGHDPGQLPLPL